MLYLFQRPRMPWERRWWPLVMIGIGLAMVVACVYLLWVFGHGLWETYQ